ncbi:MAG: SPOR domain-containing protein [Methylocystis sp.]|uniref:SPOR domain-containing protein n=1 Tax=Methylocystis sp. TaxID=1911079 RepID=UPI003DA5E119
MRELSARGPAVDLTEFERRMRSGETNPAPKASRLSELARLRQGESEADPYSRILPDPRAAAHQTPPPLPPAPQWDAGLRGSYDAAPPVASEPHYDGYHQPPYQHQPEQGYPEQGYPEEAYAESGYPQQHYDPARHGGAEGGWADDSQYLDYGGEPEDERAGGVLDGLRRRVKPWHAAVAIGVVAVGSIAWGFLHRSGAGGSKDIAVINAPEGPVKVKPSAATDQEAPPNNGAAVLDRKEPTPVKQVVTHQEQAVDPTVAPKVVTLGDGPVDAPHEPALGAQPRKVKTVTVRPDGSRVEDAAIPPAAVESVAEAPAPDPAASRGATPKPQTKPATTAQATPKPKPAPKVAAVEPPAEDDAAAAAPSASSGGTYAVQFGAAGTEEEARTLLKSVSSKYGVRATFKPAKVDGKMVYRVRAAGLSKDSANAVCNKVKATGGTCFVAGN